MKGRAVVPIPSSQPKVLFPQHHRRCDETRQFDEVVPPLHPGRALTAQQSALVLEVDDADSDQQPGPHDGHGSTGLVGPALDKNVMRSKSRDTPGVSPSCPSPRVSRSSSSLDLRRGRGNGWMHLQPRRRSLLPDNPHWRHRDRKQLPPTRSVLDDPLDLWVHHLYMAADHDLRRHLPQPRHGWRGEGALDDLRDRHILRVARHPHLPGRPRWRDARASRSSKPSSSNRRSRRTCASRRGPRTPPTDLGRRSTSRTAAHSPTRSSRHRRRNCSR